MMSSSNRDREDPLSFGVSAATNNPSSASSPATLSDPLESFLTDPPTHISSAPASFQNEGFLGENTVSSSDAEFGFTRPDFRSSKLVGSVQYYERHVFLCYKNPSVWPPRIEAAEFDRLPRLLSAAVLGRKGDMKKETRLTICEGHDGTETSNGDVLIFPDMIRYRRLTHFDVDTFVEEVLVKEGEWLPGTPEALKGSYVFVCCHGSRDRRSGVCGPPLVRRFREEIELNGLQGKVSASPCSHIGGHMYAGNVIIFGSSINGEVTGHWYGYVTPDEVPMLLERHIGKGEVVDWLWRGEMGLSEEQQIKCQETRFQLNSGTHAEKSVGDLEQNQTNELNPSVCRMQEEVEGCCQENGNSCCQNNVKGKTNDEDVGDRAVKVIKLEKRKLVSGINGRKGASVHKVCRMPTWIESWEREDTYAALAVACAAVSVAVAYSCYKKLP